MSKKEYIEGKYQVRIQRIEENDNIYSMRVYEDDEIVMSTANYLDELYKEATYWLVRK